jgi:hypothetical protein
MPFNLMVVINVPSENISVKSLQETEVIYKFKMKNINFNDEDGDKMTYIVT